MVTQTKNVSAWETSLDLESGMKLLCSKFNLLQKLKTNPEEGQKPKAEEVATA
jgi:hypothetical protein